MITAKPVVENKFWILHQDNNKIGTVEKCRGGFVLQTPHGKENFKSLKSILEKANIKFERSLKSVPKEGHDVHGFPCDAKPYNSVYNVNNRLPLFTKKEKSKSWHAAGYYRIDINGKIETHFCPKLILLERYTYIGPVKTSDGFEFK